MSFLRKLFGSASRLVQSAHETAAAPSALGNNRLQDPATYIDPRTFKDFEPDQLLALLDRRSARATRDWNWGLWRNEELAKADVLSLLGHDEEELDQVLWILYIDANEPNNVGSQPPPKLSPSERKLFRAFEGVRAALMAPAVLERAQELGGGTINKDRFLRVAQSRRRPEMPTAPDAAWKWIARHCKSGSK